MSVCSTAVGESISPGQLIIKSECFLARKFTIKRKLHSTTTVRRNSTASIRKSLQSFWVPDAKLWKMDAARAKLIFFAIELSGCLGPEAQGLCKVMAGAEGLKSIYESLSIGFQVNRALRIEHMMNDEAQIVLGLGVELLLSLIHFLGDYSVSCEV
jgi:hypothetical protein